MGLFTAWNKRTVGFVRFNDLFALPDSSYDSYSDSRIQSHYIWMEGNSIQGMRFEPIYKSGVESESDFNGIENEQ